MELRTSQKDLVTKEYVDDADGLKVPYTGATTDVDLNGKELVNLGDVGIGTTSPLAKLHVVGNARIGDPTVANAIVDIRATTTGRWRFNGANFMSVTSTGLYFDKNTQVWRNATAVEQMRLDSTGLGIGTTSPDAKLQVVGTTKLGDDNTNYSTFETTGFMEATGTAKAYRDINMAGYLLTRPASSAPDVVSFLDESGTDTTIETYGFDVDEKVHGGFELQHDYEEGSDFVFHVHWEGIAAPSGTDNVQWRLTYILMRDGTTLNAAVTIDSPDTAFDTQYESVRTDFAAITGTTFKIGDQFMFTLERVTATGDAYAGDALIATAGIHYQVNTLGSRTISVK